MIFKKITIVMPVLNEARTLYATLSRLRLSRDEELIVVDGGSTDESVSIAREFTDKVFVTETGRARVMNYGAERATGEILLFLHADCQLPQRAFRIIRTALGNNGVAAGAFDLGISNPKFRFRIIELGANLRSRVTSVPYGDQGIFLRKEVFNHIGGFADIPLMEDIELSRRLKETGKIVFVRPPMMVSARRWLEEGAIYTTVKDWALALSYSFLKTSPERLIKYYKQIR
ncbi:MAG: TIGR04283 family arsenosugar biosynthesis glycosyltransferase [Thermodesulfovibrionia bacterium]|nr:TIGR04283 family arsenosugar biosynthesis glycosyltransferase [Thermodesulfovibrionia bacterium]